MTAGGTLLKSLDITAAGPGFLPLSERYASGVNLVVNLTAGGAGLVGKINVNGKGIV